MEIPWRDLLIKLQVMNASPAPHALRSEEWDEIAALAIVREGWGFYGAETGRDLSSIAYGARFEFTSGGPGYSGDLYFVQGDALGIAPVLFIRDTTGELRPSSYWCTEGGHEVWALDGQ
jgi:hypothetical protein